MKADETRRTDDRHEAQTSDAVVGIAGAAALAWRGVPAGASAAGTAASLAAQGSLEAEPVVECRRPRCSRTSRTRRRPTSPQTGFDTQAALVAGYSAMAALYALPLLRRALGPKAEGDDFRSRQPKALEIWRVRLLRFNESPKNLKRTTDSIRAGRTARLDRTGIYLGCGQGRYYYVGGIVYMLVAGQTGAGKTRRWLLPTMELLSRGVREAFVVADPKGEIYAAMKALLEARGYAVWRIDLKQVAYSDGYDPLAIVREAWDSPRLRARPDATGIRVRHEDGVIPLDRVLAPLLEHVVRIRRHHALLEAVSHQIDVRDEVLVGGLGEGVRLRTVVERLPTRQPGVPVR